MPNNDDRLSILGFGLMRLPVKEDGNINESETLSLLHYAFENGVNYFDTAWSYHQGKNEPLLGRFLREIDRSKVFAATKLPVWLVKSEADFDTFLNSQLEHLQTDYIDYYLMHGLRGESWKEMQKLGATEFLLKAKEAGKIRHIGFSFHDDFPAFQQIADSGPWEFCQLQHNWFDVYNEAGVRGIQYASAKGLGIVIMEPIMGGKLAGNIPSEAEKIWRQSRFAVSPAVRALRFVWNYPQVQVVLSGMNKMEQVHENINAASLAEANSLPPEELKLYDQVRQIYKNKMVVHCTGCGYCLPCPNNVAIPSVLGIYNDAHMFGDKKRHQMEYNFFIKAEQKADQCTKCGTCLSRCPQKIDIPQEMEKVKAYFSE